MKNNLKSIFVALFFIGLLTPIAQAASCADDYYGFILDVRSENTRQQTIKDLFTLPYCQLYDIMELEDELDSLRDTFRTASFSCADTTVYKQQYQEILMEQYFVRNVQKSKSDVINAKDAEAFDAAQEALLATLKIEMELKFVDEEKRVSETNFDAYFTNWSAQYDDRIGDYNMCDEGPWAELTGTWTDFVTTLSNLKIDVKQPEKKSFKDIITPDMGDFKEDMSAMGKSVINTWEYVKNASNKDKVDIPQPQTAQDVANSGEAFTFDMLFETLDSEDQLYTIENNSADRMGRYALLYGSGGAVAATDMQSILVELNRVLVESNTKDFPNIITDAAKVYDKQCN